jgi:hypothetical protein
LCGGLKIGLKMAQCKTPVELLSFMRKV